MVSRFQAEKRKGFWVNGHLNSIVVSARRFKVILRLLSTRVSVGSVVVCQ
jgi:hypothetical protein